jgi:hypothetical protein
MAETPTPAFAVPYAAPKQVKTMADVQPIAPKKGYAGLVLCCLGAWIAGSRGDDGTGDVAAMRFSSTYGIDGATDIMLAFILVLMHCDVFPMH